jgi:hypothetical protein
LPNKIPLSNLLTVGFFVIHNASILCSFGKLLVILVFFCDKRLGHARVSTTTDIYGHGFNKNDIIATEKLENALLNKKSKKDPASNSV